MGKALSADGCLQASHRQDMECNHEGEEPPSFQLDR